MESLLDFQEILKQIDKKESCSLLLGNGFSISLYEHFHYKKLLDVAKNIDGDERVSSELSTLFDKLKTCDFEKIMAYLAVARKVASVYDKEFETKLNTHLTGVKNCFIKSLEKTHPKNQCVFSEEVKNQVRVFLSNFSQIFTTNYDLLPYWIFMAQEVDNEKVPKNDGFGSLPGEYRDGDLGWPRQSKSELQNFYFLHGALHFFYREDGYLTKIKRDYKEGTIMQQVSKKIKSGQRPLIVLEGGYKEKLAKIRRNEYLRSSYESLCTMTGDLVILGHSLNMCSDRHILDAIKSGNFDNIYIGVHKKSPQEDTLDILRASKKIHLFDSKTAINWEAVINENS